MKKIVVSGINLTEGGTLSIMKDCLKNLSKEFSQDYGIIALVHKKELYKDIENIKYIEFEDSKKSYLKRIYYEYFYFKKLSKELKPYLWLSMHDMTPNVEAEIRAVYCHNPMPFYKMSLKEIKLDPKLYLFNLFYKYLYKINIKKNDYVIVQQQWIAEEFKKMYGVRNVLVAHPEIKKENFKFDKRPKIEGKKIFFYPAFPRVFKNFEVICDAAKQLENGGINDCLFYLTLDKNMNKYAKYICEKYSDVKSIKFIGRTTREETFGYYEISDALIFPSKLETWGLPITEYKEFNKPIILADLEYAHETVGDYGKVIFFNQKSSKELSDVVSSIREDKMIFIKNQKIGYDISGWKNLLNKLTFRYRREKI